MPLRAVLFDLDGTLLDNDMDLYITHYLRRFAPHVAHRVPPDEFVQAWMHGLQLMLRNADPHLTNQQVFDLSFYPRLGVAPEELRSSMEVYYTTSHPNLRRLATRRPGARETVEAMLDAGLKIVIATNPIFPEVIIGQRLEWTGIADLPFALVTTSENMHAAKPSQRFYREILDRIGVAPEETVMIGDDFINDVQPPSRLGIHTYWVNVSTTTPPNFDPKSRGELHRFYTWLVSTGLLEDVG